MSDQGLSEPARVALAAMNLAGSVTARNLDLVEELTRFGLARLDAGRLTITEDGRRKLGELNRQGGFTSIANMEEDPRLGE